jgi:hypothetical protein
VLKIQRLPVPILKAVEGDLVKALRDILNFNVDEGRRDIVGDALKVRHQF